MREFSRQSFPRRVVAGLQRREFRRVPPPIKPKEAAVWSYCCFMALYETSAGTGCTSPPIQKWQECVRASRARPAHLPAQTFSARSAISACVTSQTCVVALCKQEGKMCVYFFFSAGKFQQARQKNQTRMKTGLRVCRNLFAT